MTRRPSRREFRESEESDMPRKKQKKVGRTGIRLVDPITGQGFRNLDLVDNLLYGDQAFSNLLDDAAAFESEEEERATWELNKDLLLSLSTEDPNDNQLKIYVGHRPWAWWKYDSGVGPEVWGDWERFGYGFAEWQYKHLKDHGLLRDGEEAAVARLRVRLAEQERRMRPGLSEAE